jgi:hypothetical protein
MRWLSVIAFHTDRLFNLDGGCEILFEASFEALLPKH